MAHSYRVSQHIWPDSSKNPNAGRIKARVMTAISLLAGAKLINIQVPFVFKSLVDMLDTSVKNNSGELTGSTEGTLKANVENLLDKAGSADLINNLDEQSLQLLFASPVAMALGYGIARSTAEGMAQLRSAVFAKAAAVKSMAQCWLT